MNMAIFVVYLDGQMSTDFVLFPSVSINVSMEIVLALTLVLVR